MDKRERTEMKEEAIGVINYDHVTVNRLLKTVEDNEGAFPLEDKVIPYSGRGVTSKAVYDAVKEVKDCTTNNKGYFRTEDLLKKAYPSSDIGNIAYVGVSPSYRIYEYSEGAWTDTGQTYTPAVSLGDYYTKEEVDGMQEVQAVELDNVGIGANYAVLAYTSSVAVTRLQVPESRRKQGYMVSYDSGAGFVKEIYVGTDVSATEWQKDSNWRTELPAEDVKALAGQAALSARESQSACEQAEQASVTASEQAERAETLVKDAESSIAKANEAAGHAESAATEARTQAEAAKTQAAEAGTQAESARIQAAEAGAQAESARVQASAAQLQAKAAGKQAAYSKQQGDYAKEMEQYIEDNLGGANFIDITELFRLLATDPSSPGVEGTVSDEFIGKLEKAHGAKAVLGVMMIDGAGYNFPLSIHKTEDATYEVPIFVNDPYMSYVLGQKEGFMMLVAMIESASKKITLAKTYIHEADGGTAGGKQEIYTLNPIDYGMTNSSGTIEAGKWNTLKAMLDRTCTDYETGTPPEALLMVYLGFFSAPAIVTKNSGNYQILISVFAPASGELATQSVLYQINCSKTPVTYTYVNGASIAFTSSGKGDRYLADDGTYRAIPTIDLEGRVDELEAAIKQLEPYKIPVAFQDLPQDGATSEEISDVFGGRQGFDEFVSAAISGRTVVLSAAPTPEKAGFCRLFFDFILEKFDENYYILYWGEVQANTSIRLRYWLSFVHGKFSYHYDSF